MMVSENRLGKRDRWCRCGGLCILVEGKFVLIKDYMSGNVNATYGNVKASIPLVSCTIANKHT